MQRQPKYFVTPFTTRRVAWFLSLLLFVGLPAIALAHPLGDFVVNRYSGLTLNAAEIQILYVVDMAEVPTFQEKVFIDQNDDDHLSASEQERYLTQQVEKVQSNLQLEIDGQPLTLGLKDKSLAFLPGNNSLETMRLEARFTAAMPAGVTTWQAEYRDENFKNRIGWQEVVIQPAETIALLESSVPTEDLSQALTHYPENITPPEVTQANFRFEPAGLSGQRSVSVAANAGETEQSPLAQGDEEFRALINTSLTSPSGVALALLAAFSWGAAHALTPGHGKAVVAAYLVGTRGTIKHAFFLGLTTTITHTAGVFILGLITIFAAQYILPEQLYPWLGVGSGLLVVVIGLSLFRGRLLGMKGHPHHHDHDQGHSHDDSHYHNHDHPHDHDDAHDHGHDHSHDHDHDHAHSHDHNHDHPHDHDHDHDHHHPHDHSYDHGHSHGEHDHHHSSLFHHHHHGDDYGHSHMPPGTDGEPITWRSLLALGVSGGLIPCPAALIIMLAAVTLQKIGFGLLLILVFSLGLAGVLTAIGVMWVKARDLLNWFSQRSGLSAKLPGGGGFWTQALPAASALFITIIGLGLTLQALMQTGVFGS